MKNKTAINTSLTTLHLNKRKSQTFSVFRYITIISSDEFCIAQYRRTLKDVHNNENMINWKCKASGCNQFILPI